MNKIFNWLFGACFRTLGRFLAIFIVFALLLFVGSKLDLEMPSWLGLKVNASEIYNGYVGECIGCNDVIIGYTGKSISFNSAGSINGTIKLELDNQFNIYSNTDYINIPVYFESLSAYSYYTYPMQNGVYETNVYLPINSYTVFIEYITSDNLPKYNTCTFNQANTNGYGILKCYVYSDVVRINSLALYYSLNNPSLDLQPLKFAYNRNFSFYIKDNTNNQIIENQEQTNDKLDDVNQSLQDTNQSIQDTNDNIMNNDSPNVSGMTDLAGYLPPGPLDSVLNLPLSILNSLNTQLSSSCTPLSLTLPFVNLPLNIPCLSTIFNQISGLNILWQSLGLLFGALIMYQYLVYLYNWVDDVTSLHHNKARLFGAKSDADNWGRVD